jgi:hypothetical protein
MKHNKDPYQVAPLNHLSENDTIRHMQVRHLSNEQLRAKIKEAIANEKAWHKTRAKLDSFEDGLKLSKEDLFKTVMFNKAVKQ